MKIEWLVTNVAAIGSPDRAERAILGVILAGHVFDKSRSFCGRGATCHLMKMEWLITDVIAVGSSGRAECAIFGLILARHFLAKFRTICDG